MNKEMDDVEGEGGLVGDDGGTVDSERRVLTSFRLIPFRFLFCSAVCRVCL